MISVDIPGFRSLELQHLVCDYNGTLALDGELLPGVAEALSALSDRLRIHVITADTFGLARGQLSRLALSLAKTPSHGQALAKRQFVTQLGADSVVAIGNGRNDCQMLQAAALGIALVQREGAAADALASADLIALNVLDALEMLRNQKRLIATLRS